MPTALRHDGQLTCSMTANSSNEKVIQGVIAMISMEQHDAIEKARVFAKVTLDIVRVDG